MLLRTISFLPLIVYLALAVALAARPDEDPDLFRMIVSGAGSFLIYFYAGLAIAALLPLAPRTRLVLAAALPTMLFLLLAAADLPARSSSSSSGGFISLDFNYKTFWLLPGIFLTRAIAGRP